MVRCLRVGINGTYIHLKILMYLALLKQQCKNAYIGYINGLLFDTYPHPPGDERTQST